MRLIKLRACHVPSASFRTAVAFERMEPPVGVADATECMARAGNCAPYFSARSSVTSSTGTPRRASSLASASAGKQMTAGAAGGQKHAAIAARHFTRSMIAERGRLRVTAMRKPMPMASEISDEPP